MAAVAVRGVVPRALKLMNVDVVDVGCEAVNVFNRVVWHEVW